MKSEILDNQNDASYFESGPGKAHDRSSIETGSFNY